MIGSVRRRSSVSEGRRQRKTQRPSGGDGQAPDSHTCCGKAFQAAVVKGTKISPI